MHREGEQVEEVSVGEVRVEVNLEGEVGVKVQVGVKVRIINDICHHEGRGHGGGEGQGQAGGAATHGEDVHGQLRLEGAGAAVVDVDGGHP